MTHLVIENQNSNVEIVSAAIIQKVYEMALSAEGDVSLKGNLQSDYAKQTAYDYLTGNLTGTSTKRFPNLSLNITGGIYVDFADPEVERVLISHNVGNGIGVTQADLQNVTSLGTWFQNNTTIQSFDELRMTGVTSLSNSAFSGCTSLSNINLSNVRYIGSNAFVGCTSLSMEVELTLTQSALDANIFKDCPITKLVIHDQNLTDISVRGSGQHYITEELPNVTYIDFSDTNIQQATFRNDKQLVTAIIPANNSVLSPNNYNFVEFCENLQYIIITNTSQVVTPLNDTLKYMFKGNNAPNANIYVPDTLLSQYQSSSSWNDATYAPTFATTRIKGHSELPSNITWATKTSA